MKDCKYEELIDDYLMNRLADEKKDRFEEHYFNCLSCFEKIAERDELLRVIKNKGYAIFKDEFLAQEIRGASWPERILSFLSPKQWAFAAVSAALVLLIIFNVIPYFKSPQPTFQISGEEAYRGQSIELISPLMDINAVPTEFRWAKSDKELEYKFSIYDNGNALWTTTTKENFVLLPEETRNLIKPEGKYSWQVKAFSSEGTLVAVSSKVYFKVTKSD
jgi:hypothetical protein